MPWPARAAGATPRGTVSPRLPTRRQQLESVLTEHIDFDAFDSLTGSAGSPALFVSAVNVLSGDLVTFRDGEITPDAVVASAAVPHLFEAVEIGDEYYWDGVLSQNPPLLELVLDETLQPVDELWIIRLSPKRTAELPTTEHSQSHATGRSMSTSRDSPAWTASRWCSPQKSHTLPWRKLRWCSG